MEFFIGGVRMKKMSLAKRMAIALVLGIAAGVGVIALRVNLINGGNAATWTTINNLLFATSNELSHDYIIIIFGM